MNWLTLRFNPTVAICANSAETGMATAIGGVAIACLQLERHGFREHSGASTTLSCRSKVRGTHRTFPFSPRILLSLLLYSGLAHALSKFGQTARVGRLLQAPDPGSTVCDCRSGRWLRRLKISWIFSHGRYRNSRFAAS